VGNHLTLKGAWVRNKSKRIARVFRRTSTRIPVALLLRGQRRSNRHRASVLQTSFLGMRVQTHLALRRGQLVRIVRLTGTYLPVPARVIWVGTAKPDKQRHVGLKFTDPMHARIAPH
jgi:hypothetical protein